MNKSKTVSINVFNFNNCICVYISGHVHATECVWISEESLWSWSSMSTTWLTGTKLRSSGLVVSAYTY